MADTYDITYDGVTVGVAKMEKQGLYYAFSCRCRLPEEGLYRIHVIIADKREDLGICVPIGSAFGMDKKLSLKRLGEGRPVFELLPRDWKPQEVIPEPIPQQEIMEVEESMAEEAPFVTEPEEIMQADACEERFVPVSEEEPFDYLDKLENAHMEIRDDVPGIVIQE